MHATLNRNFQVMPGAEWLEFLCRHIPDRYEHLVRYYGWYSSRTRAAVDIPQPAEIAPIGPLNTVLTSGATSLRVYFGCGTIRR